MLYFMLLMLRYCHLHAFAYMPPAYGVTVTVNFNSLLFSSGLPPSSTVVLGSTAVPGSTVVPAVVEPAVVVAAVVVPLK